MAEDTSPGSPRWYLSRLTQRLLSRQHRYDILERYATGNHPLPNGDKRFVRALREIQRKSRTNYCELVIKAVTQRMAIDGFQFGPEEQSDEDAKAIWNYNYMDLQSMMFINSCGTFGDGYLMLAPPIEDDGQPLITVEDPRSCIVEPDPRIPYRNIAGLKMWQDEVTSEITAILYLEGSIYEYVAPAVNDPLGFDAASLTKRLTAVNSPGGFRLISVQPNPFFGVSFDAIPLERANWQPAFGTLGRAEHEGVLDVQDRINLTILERLVIGKSQAYNQRFVTGAKPGEEFRPGADMVWATRNSDAKFGQFEAVDITPVLMAIRDDVGDMAAISQTPGTYLMNRMVNVSGDTLTQDQVALVTKVRQRHTAVGVPFEKIMRKAFSLMGNAKAKETQVVTRWKDPEFHSIAEMGDLFSKLTSGGVPLDVAMKTTGLFTDDQIESAVKQAEAQKAEESKQAADQMKLQASLKPAAPKA